MHLPDPLKRPLCSADSVKVSASASDGTPSISSCSPAFLARLRMWIPRGHELPTQDWAVRHRVVWWVLAVHVPLVLGLGLQLCEGRPGQVILLAAVPGIGAVLAAAPMLGRSVRSSLAAAALTACSSMIIELFDNAVAAHAHVFIVIPVIALYERWLPFGVGMTLVVLDHGLLGMLRTGDTVPGSWRVAALHAAVVACASIGSLVNWRLHERSRGIEVALTQRLRHRARHDHLTGLPNRDWLLEDAATDLGLISGAYQPVAMVVFDVDRFREVNDTLGHDVGDQLLLEVARRLDAATEPGERAVRLGSDEFAVVLTGERARFVAEVAGTLRHELTSERVSLDGIDLDLEVTVGVASDDGTGRTAHDQSPGHPTDEGQDLRRQAMRLLRCADVALNTGKRAKAPISVYDRETDRHTVERLALLTDLREALFNDQLQLAYQPKLRLADGALVGVEALLRWTHPVRGPIPPMEFIPAADTTNLVVPLTHRVLGLALHQARLWRTEGLRVRVSVNVPPRWFAEDNVVQDITSALDANGLPADHLCLEITETSILDDPGDVLAVLTELRAAGIQLSLDDFGTGYSSLAYLQRLPVDELKIDQSFVRGLLHHHEDAVLIETTIALGHRLGMTVVAEGVEDEGTANILSDLGCDQVQGYLYAPAMPASMLLPWAESRRRGSAARRG